mmetsp:Transcript_157739/g.505905  ORF Transcript_157739/g.505905 Transcript_157739/m.505905 type:complete len:280 (-) Transcript_157739:521-1360(-)
MRDGHRCAGRCRIAGGGGRRRCRRVQRRRGTPGRGRGGTGSRGESEQCPLQRVLHLPHVHHPSGIVVDARGDPDIRHAELEREQLVVPRVVFLLELDQRHPRSGTHQVRKPSSVRAHNHVGRVEHAADILHSGHRRVVCKNLDGPPAQDLLHLRKHLDLIQDVSAYVLLTLHQESDTSPRGRQHLRNGRMAEDCLVHFLDCEGLNTNSVVSTWVRRWEIRSLGLPPPVEEPAASFAARRLNADQTCPGLARVLNHACVEKSARIFEDLGMLRLHPHDSR